MSTENATTPQGMIVVRLNHELRKGFLTRRGFSRTTKKVVVGVLEKNYKIVEEQGRLVRFSEILPDSKITSRYQEGYVRVIGTLNKKDEKIMKSATSNARQKFVESQGKYIVAKIFVVNEIGNVQLDGLSIEVPLPYVVHYVPEKNCFETIYWKKLFEELRAKRTPAMLPSPSQQL